MGVTFLYAGIQHLTDPSYFDPSKPGYIGNLISHYAVGSPIHDFLLGAVAPNPVAFGYLVAVAESLIGVAVLFGFLFRIAAFFGLVLNLTFFLSATWNAFPYYFGSDIVFVFAWLTLLFTGPQAGLSIDGFLARRLKSMQWLVQPTIQTGATTQTVVESPTIKNAQVPVPERAKLYPKQVAEVNRAFERIEQQFVSHEETQTVLEFVRAFVISLGVDRNEANKILSGINNIVNRSGWDEPSQQGAQ
jgi:thiosulfate dehydrogenase [quinone] large subunit